MTNKTPTAEEVEALARNWDMCATSRNPDSPYTQFAAKTATTLRALSTRIALLETLGCAETCESRKCQENIGGALCFRPENEPLQRTLHDFQPGERDCPITGGEG